MANQSPDRRQVLEMLAKVAAISQFPGFSKWVCAAEQAAPVTQPTYKTQFFNDSEFRLLDTLCELIIPADENPGAHATGVAEFIDFMVSHDEDQQYPFRTGLAWMNAFAREQFGAEFVNVPATDQEKLLRRLAYRKQQAASEKTGQDFFMLVRRYTVMGYYTTKIGLQALDYPGLKFYSASPECPHKDDPEHKHLAVPR